MSKSKKPKIIFYLIIICLISGALLIEKALNPGTVLETTFSSEDVVKRTVPTQLTFQDQTIPLLWTDDNTNENLIIQTDRRYYDGHNQSFVYLSITNTTNQTQETDIYFWFDDTDKGVKSIKKIDPNNSGTAETGTVSETVSSPEDAVEGTVPVQRKPINNYTAGYQTQDIIQPNQTNFYQAVITYPPQSQGEFFVEAIADKGAYGHLDPYFASGLVGYWSFNGQDVDWATNTAYDRSGQSNDGAITNMSTSTDAVPGISGQALDFDGVDDYVSVPTDASLNITNNITLMAWVNWNGSADYDHIVSKTTINGTDGYFFRISNADKLDFQIGSSVLGTDNTISTNSWQCLAATYDGSTMTIYINGNFNKSQLKTGSIPTNSTNLYIGSFLTNFHWFDGLIDEVRIYNRALSADEVMEHYRAGARKLQPDTPFKPQGESGLVGYWSFNGQDVDWATNTAYDRSGQSNDGAITNMSTSTDAVPGISGQALDFDGSDDYINIPLPQSVLNNSKSYTVAAWFYSFEYDSIDHVAGIIESRTVGTDWWIDLDDLTNKLRYRIYNPLGFYDAVTNTQINNNQWYYVAVTRDETTNNHSVYLNGIFEKNIIVENPKTGSTGIRIGSNNLDPDRFFNGTIDEVRIYNRALSADEVLELYRAGARKLQPDTPFQPQGESGLVGYWSFNGQDVDWATNTAFDRSGQSNDGAITNMSTSTDAVPGISGQALDFDGSDDSVEVMDNSNTFDIPVNMSFGVWINIQGAFGGTNGFIVGGNALNSWGLFVLGASKKVTFSTNLGGWADCIGTTVLNNNQWYHIAGYYNGSNVVFYINGKFEKSCPDSGNLPAVTGIYIGKTIGRSEAFNGTIDEVRIYNRALSADEVTDLYRAGARRMKVSQ